MGFFASLDKRRVLTVAVTLVLALASGYLMENVLSERTSRIEPSGPPPDPQIPAAEQVSALGAPPVMPLRTREEWKVRRGTQSCQPRLFVNPAPAATLRIDLYAPCTRNAPVTLRQDAVTVALRTDEKGRVTARMPAFANRATVEVSFGEYELAATAEVPGTDDFRHVIVAWEGVQDLRINAYEFGASKSEMGHVWTGSPKSPTRAAQGSGGFLTRLGDGSGPAAEIYSFPFGRFAGHGVVRLVVEAAVTKANCGRELKADAFRSGDRGQLVHTEVALAMPGCDREGEIVRLQNLLGDLRLAER